MGRVDKSRAAPVVVAYRVCRPECSPEMDQAKAAVEVSLGDQAGKVEGCFDGSWLSSKGSDL